MNRRFVLAALLLSATVVAQEPISPGGEKGPGTPAGAPVPRVSAPALTTETEEAPAPAKPEEPKPFASREAADALTEEELAQVVDLLRNNYIQPGQLTELALARAGIQGVLDRLGAGARIYSKTTTLPEAQSPLRSE